MAIQNYPKRWLNKPPVGVQINRGHPLAAGMIGCWLFNEGAGNTVQDLASGFSAAVTSPNTTMWVNDPMIGTAFNHQHPTHDTFIQESYPTVSLPVSVVAIITASLLSDGNRLQLFGHNDGTATFAQGFYIYGNGANPSVLHISFGGAGGDSAFSSLTIGSNNTYYLVAVTVDKSNGTGTGYLGVLGTPLTVQAVTIAGAMGTPTIIRVGADPSSIASEGHSAMTLYYNRLLTASEVNWLNADPFAFLRPMSPVIRQNMRSGLTVPNEGNRAFFPDKLYSLPRLSMDYFFWNPNTPTQVPPVPRIAGAPNTFVGRKSIVVGY